MWVDMFAWAAWRFGGFCRTISDQVSVPERVRVGAGALVLHDVLEEMVVVGAPVGPIRPNKR